MPHCTKKPNPFYVAKFYITVDVFFIFLGRYDLSMPELGCDVCQATWSAGLDDLIKNDYWPATLHFATIYSTDIFYSFEEMKMAAPGLSCQAYLRMLDRRTVQFGHVSIEVINPTSVLISLYCGLKHCFAHY